MRRITLLVAVLAVGCSEPASQGAADAAGPKPDGGALADAGTPLDAGAQADAGIGADAGGHPPPYTAGGCPQTGFLRLVEVADDTGLAAALSDAQPGDQIRLAAGTYAGARMSASGTDVAPIAICGMPGEYPVLKRQFESTGSYLTITGLVFEGPIDAATNQVYLHSCHHVTFTRNVIRNGDFHAGLSVDEAHHMTVTYNYIHDNGVDSSHDHGIYYKTTTGDGSVISHNLLVGNAARGLSLHDNSGVGVFDVLVAHNTVAGNGSTGILVNDGDRITLVNNLSAFNGDDTGQDQIRILAGDQNVARNNLTWSADSSRAGIENTTASEVSGNAVGDPRFASAFGDLHLGAGSPAIDLGLPGYSDLDYDGNARRAAPDVGAYEAAP